MVLVAKDMDFFCSKFIYWKIIHVSEEILHEGSQVFATFAISSLSSKVFTKKV